MADRLIVRDDGNVYRLVPNETPTDDDYGSYVEVTPAELLAGALRILSEDLLADALEIAAVAT